MEDPDLARIGRSKRRASAFAPPVQVKAVSFADQPPDEKIPLEERARVSPLFPPVIFALFGAMTAALLCNAYYDKNPPAEGKNAQERRERTLMAGVFGGFIGAASYVKCPFWQKKTHPDSFIDDNE